MANRLWAHAWEVFIPNMPRKMTLVALAFKADDKNCQCSASFKELAEWTKLSRSTIKRAIRYLEENHIIMVRRGSGGKKALYLLTLPEKGTTIPFDGR